MGRLFQEAVPCALIKAGEKPGKKSPDVSSILSQGRPWSFLWKIIAAGVGDRAILQRVGSEKGVIACKCWVTDVEKFASEESREMEWWGMNVEMRNEG